MEQTKNTGRGDLQALLSMLRRRIALILFAVIVTAGLAVGASALQNKEYQATSNLLFKSLYLDAQVSGLPLQIPGDADRDAETNRRLVSLPEVRARAAGRLGRGFTADNLKDQIKVESDGQSSLVAVTATGSTPQQAALIANTLGQEFVAYRRETLRGQIDAAVERVRGQLERSSSQTPAVRRALRNNLEKLRLLSSVQTSDAQLVNRASPPDSQSAPKPVRNGLFGAFVGLLLGLALALAAEQLDRRVRRPEQLSEAMGIPVVGSIPRSKSIKKGRSWSDGLAGGDAEAFRRLRANLRYSGKEEIKSILLTSATPESGKTTIALHLAAAAAAGGARVLLIEGDLRRPQLSYLLDLPDEAGLSTLLENAYGHAANGNGSSRRRRGAAREDRDGLEGAYKITSGHSSEDTPQDRVRFQATFDVVSAGPTPSNASELLASPAMEDIVDRAKSLYDLVIIDGPPTNVVSDAIPLMKRVDGVLVVGRLGRESRDAIADMRREFEQLDVHPVGVVANFAKPQPKSPYYAASR